MSDAARLSARSFATKPTALPYSNHKPTTVELTGIRFSIQKSALESAYSAIISYSEALSEIQKSSISWPIIKLYYSCFYSVRSLLILNNVVPFNSGREMLLDTHTGRFFRGGRSSHHWNWKNFSSISSIKSKWFTSEDSKEAYEALRKHRENVNYTHHFTDPDIHECLGSAESDLPKRFREYRDDSAFLYTYLDSHLAIAYPTKLIFELDATIRNSGIRLEDSQIAHINKVWSIKDRCPLVS